MWPWGGFEIYVYKYWRIPFVFLFRHHLFLNWWSWFAWFVDFFNRFPNQKMANQKFRHRFRNPANLDIGVCFFFSLPLAPANGQEHRWSLSTVTVTSPSFSEDLFGVENWVEDSGSLTLSLVFFVVFFICSCLRIKQRILEQMWRDFKKEGFWDVLIFLIDIIDSRIQFNLGVVPIFFG